MSHYKLVYFHNQGLGESIRLLLNYSKIEFEDVQVHWEAWPEIKPTAPYGKLPFLVVDGKNKIGESCAIARFLANRVGLIVKNDIERAILESLADLTNEYFIEISSFLAVIGKLKEGDENQLQIKLFLPAIHKFLPYLVTALKESNSGYLGKSGISWVDFYVVPHIQTIKNLVPKELNQYPEVEEHLERIYSLPELQKYLSERRATLI